MEAAMAGPFTQALKAAGILGAIAMTPLRVFAAETAHLYLKADGSDIKGESTVESLGRKDSIECLAWFTSVNPASPASSGRITIKKAIDKSTPLLMKALVEQQKIDATFKFFRPSPKGDGTTQQFYTIAIKDGRIVSMEEVVPDVFDPGTANLPPMDAVTFDASIYIFTFTDGGVSHQWDKNTVKQ
jgi:type VI secretion system secreted protein Hcp